MAFVVVTHQHPGHTSLLPELLTRHSQMPVVEAADGVEVQPNQVYIGPPGAKLAIFSGALHVMEASARAGAVPLPIDFFFRALADDQRERAICVVLSGTGTDGTLGVRAVKAASGMAMVQDVESAQYPGMPSSAIATGMADYTLAPAAMPEQLVAYTRGPYPISERRKPAVVPAAPVQKILLLLRNRTGHDFSSYKSSTVCRRIERRMNVQQVRGPDHYLRFLEETSKNCSSV
jgi:two-component system CheB/CheR fusion protein